MSDSGLVWEEYSLLNCETPYRDNLVDGRFYILDSDGDLISASGYKINWRGYEEARITALALIEGHSLQGVTVRVCDKDKDSCFITVWSQSGEEEPKSQYEDYGSW